jgi:hypothetical protein
MGNVSMGEIRRHCVLIPCFRKYVLKYLEMIVRVYYIAGVFIINHLKFNHVSIHIYRSLLERR